MAMVNIEGLDKAWVLLVLWNCSQMQGRSSPCYKGELTLRRAKGLIEQYRHTSTNGEERIEVDSLLGKVMKIDLAPDIIDTRMYDLDNGEGAGENAIENLRLALKVARGELSFEEGTQMSRNFLRRDADARQE